jgi:glycosyltransferase involved in cell wall biosynthesis
MTAALVVALVLAIALAGYAYVGYAGLLKLVSTVRPRRAAAPVAAPAEWPAISITIPVYNEAATIGATLERLLQADYPADRRQILVVSDASTDGTDDVVRSFADRGVELLRLPVRKGKTAAENATLPHLRGEIVVNMDATIQIVPDALRPLIAAFADPTVGVASGRDVSVARHGGTANQGESGYASSRRTSAGSWERQDVFMRSARTCTAPSSPMR